MNWIKKHKIITVILVFIVLIAISSGGSSNKNTDNATNNNSNTSKTDDKSEKKTEDKETVAKIGEPVRDGKFEFTVNGIECGKTSIGTNEYLRKEAQGQFCSLDLSIKNIGDKKQSLFSSDQKLFNAEGHEYSADDSATIYTSLDSSTWYNDINPGNSVSGVIIFDIPKDQTPVSAQLHDSTFSNGVKVSLQ